MKPLLPPDRLPFHYGWVVVAVAFVTMAVAVNVRTSFSLLFPAILDEFGWQRGVTAAAFSVGFMASVAPDLLRAWLLRHGRSKLMARVVERAETWRADLTP